MARYFMLALAIFSPTILSSSVTKRTNSIIFNIIPQTCLLGNAKMQAYFSSQHTGSRGPQSARQRNAIPLYMLTGLRLSKTLIKYFEIQ